VHKRLIPVTFCPTIVSASWEVSSSTKKYYWQLNTRFWFIFSIHMVRK